MSYNVKYPDAEAHEVLPRLYLGGHLWADEYGRVKAAKHSSVSEDLSWDYVVSCYLDNTFNAEKAIPQCDMRFVLFDDTRKGLSDDTWRKINLAVDEIATRWLRGEKILVRCQAGYNRSGLMMCLVLMRLGYTAKQAVDLARKGRGSDVLVNQVFESYVHDREQEYFLPENLVYTEGLLEAVAEDEKTLLK